MIRAELRPELIRWARERSRLPFDKLLRRFPRLDAWERGDANPTLKQVEDFAKATHTPVGFLFLREPPVETLPLPDFRTVDNAWIGNPSPDLLDMVYVCQQRQEWYRDFARSTGEEPLGFVGSVGVDSEVEATAASIRGALNFDLEQRRQAPTWAEALRHFIEQADTLGNLVMCSGVVLSNNHRRLDPTEFRGFAIADDLAPLVFINGADTKSAQMFTLAHELAHIWLGQSAVSDVEAARVPEHVAEAWCNRVAAELLVPLAVLLEEYDEGSGVQENVGHLARRFKVSTLVILHRIHDGGWLTREQLWELYEEELRRLLALPRGSGGNFYLTLAARVSKRFARGLVISTLEGQTPHRDAFRMLGLSKLQTFHELGQSLGIGA